MKSSKYQSDEERTILTAMIVNDRVLTQVHACLKGERKPFRSRWCNLVGGWCVDHVARWGKAPRGTIQTLFGSFAQESKDEDTVALVEKFLSTLSENYKALSKEINEDYVLDMASRFFNRVKMNRLSEQISEELEKNDSDSAYGRISAFTPIQLATTDVIDVFTDQQAWLDTLTQREDNTLIHYPKDLGDFFGDSLERDAFVAFLAPEKRGKTFWLIDMAYRAVQSKRKTLLYSVGDMSKGQMMRRLIVRAARRPYAAVSVTVPKGKIYVDKGTLRIKGGTERFENYITKKELLEAQKRIQLKSASKQSLLKLRCTPNSTTRVADIDADIQQLIKEGWVPDVIVVDYMDILAAESSTAEDYRHTINESWKAMRRLSQKYHCLVVTATQADAASYEVKTLRRSNFSEDKRKFSHVTGMVGINQTEEEKRVGVYRLNWVIRRESDFLESKCIYTAGCLAVANPAIISQW